MEEKLKHLEFIQGVITRMNSNSFSIKTWMMTILGALLALFASNHEPLYLLVATAPTLIFWCLDAKYLKMERQYRLLYTAALEGKVTVFDMNASKYSVNFINVLFSKTILWVYVPIVLGLIAGWLFASGIL
jgi:hypothetical protein